MPCERAVVLYVLAKARMHGVDLRIVPDLYEGLAWDNPIEYIGQFPTIPLHRGHVPELGFVLKRARCGASSANRRRSNGVQAEPSPAAGRYTEHHRPVAG